MTKKLFLTLLLFSYFGAFAQSKKIETLTKKAKQAFDGRDFQKAKQFYLKLLEIDPQPSYHFMLGKIASISRNEEEAIDNYRKTIAVSPTDKQFVEAHSYIGIRELRMGHYEKAKGFLNFAFVNTPSSSMLYHALKERIEEAEMGIHAMKNAVEIHPIKLPPFLNKFTKQYFPVLTADNSTLFFTAIDEKGDENIFESTIENNNYSEPKLIGGGLHSKYNEGTCSISADGRTMVFTSCEGRNTYGSCDLFIVYKNGNEWGFPQNLGQQINSPFWESQPALSSDGKLLFFTSERPGGFGGKDLWISQLNKKNEWSKAVNLGKKINTVKDDISPFIHANGKTFFFASNGKKTLGGFDLFMSEINEGNLTEPENLGYPINNASDQISLFITADGKTAYYAIDDNKKIELYRFEMPKEIEIKYRKTDFIKGKVYSTKNNNTLKSEINIVDLGIPKTILTTFSDSISGEYLAVLPHGAQYALHVSKDGYLFKSLNFDFVLNDAANGKELDIFLEPIEKEVDIVLSNIFFDSGAWVLSNESFFELEKLVELLTTNPKISAEIRGHTDNVGNENDNLTLSKNRADAVVSYLIQKGVNPSRLNSIGLGESSPIVENTTEENKQQNRRIEFRIK